MSIRSVFLRVSLMILVFLLGFMSCIGAIVGGAVYVYKNVSLDTFNVDTKEFLDPEAEVDLSAITLEKLVAEVQYMSTLGDKMSLNLMIDRYGFILPKDVTKYIPENLYDMPLSQLFTMDGIMEVLSTVYVGDLLQYTKSELEDGSVIWTSADGKEITGITAKLASFAVGDFVSGSFTVGNLLEEITIADVLEMSSDDALRVYLDSNGEKQLLGDKTVVVWYNNDGTRAEGVVAALAGFSVMEISNHINDLGLADIAGMEEYAGEYYNVSVENDSLGAYVLLSEGSGIIAELADLSVSELMSGNITDTLGDVQVGTVMGYTYDEENGIWTSDGNKATGIMAALADKKIGELESSVDEITIADVMGYTYDEVTGTYYDENGNKATGVIGALADKQIGELESSVDELTLSEVMGYTYDSVTDTYYDENGDKVTGVMAALADKQIGELDNSVDDITVAEAMGYTYDAASDAWIDANGEKASGVTAALADKKINELDGAVDELTIADVMNYTYDSESDAYYDENGDEASGILAALADKKINELDGAVDELVLYEVMGYTYNSETDTYYDENGDEVTGVMAALADKKVNELDGAFDELTISEIMDYTYDEATDTYYDSDNEKVSGIMSAIADKRVSELDQSVGLVKIGEIAEFTYVDGVWYEIYDAENTSNSKEASGILGAFADLTIDEMTDNNALGEKIKTLTVADALGYEYNEVDGKWYDEENEITGIMAVIADAELDSIQTTVEASTMGDILGYTYNEEENWWYDENGPVHVMMNSVANKTFSNIDSLSSDLSLADVIPAEDLNSGFLQLLDPDTKIDSLGTAVNDTFDSVTLRELMGDNDGTGVIKIEQADNLDMIIGSEWRDQPLSSAFDYIIGALISKLSGSSS